MSQSRTAPIVSPRGALLVTALSSYAFFLPTGGWNENSRLDLTMAIVDEGRATIDSFAHNTADKARCGLHRCSDKAPGVSWLATLPYAAYRGVLDASGRPAPRSRLLHSDSSNAAAPRARLQISRSFVGALYWCGLVVAAAPTALAIILLVSSARRWGVDERTALLVGGCYGLGTIAFPYATVMFGHQLAGSLLLAGLTAARHATTTDRRPRVWLLLAGLCVGYATLSEYPAALGVLAIGLYLLWQLPRRRDLAWYLAGGLPCALALGMHNWRLFGHPLRVGYQQLVDSRFARGHRQGLLGLTFPRPRGLWGILFGRFRGLLYVSPVLAFSLPGWISAWRRRVVDRPQLLLVAGLPLAFILLNASYYMWWGGAAAGPRHLVPILPLLCLPLGQASLGRGRPLVLACGAISALNALVLTVAGVSAPEQGDLLLDHAWPTALGLRPRGGLGNLGFASGLLPWPVSWLPLLALWLGALLYIRVHTEGREPAPSAPPPT